MAVTVELGLGGIFRDVLINADDIVSAYACSELVSSVARDIAYGRNPGTWVNADGCTRGVAGDLPEGNLACLFDGTGYIRVAHDGEGYQRSGDSGARNLSCANGDIDVVVLCKITTNDATKRVLAQKKETNATGNGWSVWYQSGAIGFTFTKAGVDVFSFSRGSVAGIGWLLVHCTTDTAAGIARIYLQGVQSGSTQAFAAGTEPAINTGDMLIGRFADGSGVCLDTISYVGIGRNGSTTLAALLQATRSWTDVSTDVRRDPPEVACGIDGQTFKDRIAKIGTFNFVLNNLAIPGRYTVGHANCRSGFKTGIPVRHTDGGVYRHRGRLKRADPEPGLYGQRRVFAMSEDWLAAAARSPVSAVPILTDVRSDRAWAVLIDQADYPPVAVSMIAGSETFPFFGDVVSGDVMQEMRKVTESEGGYSYVAPDSVTGGVVTFEPRGVRQLDTVVDAAFTSTMRITDLQASVDDEVIINRCEGTLTPRRAGATDTDVLVVQDTRQRIDPHETATFEGRYQDPAQSRSDVGGTDFQTLTSGTDYTFTPNSDGTGVDISANIDIDAEIGGSGYVIKFTNTGDQPGYLAFQIRGRALYTDIPTTVRAEHEGSIRAHGLRPQTLEFAYLNDRAAANNLLQLPVNLFNEPVTVPQPITFRCHPTSALATTLSGISVGSRISVTEAMTALSSAKALWVQSDRRRYEESGLLEVTLGVFPSFAGSAEPFAAWDGTDWDESLWGF